MSASSTGLENHGTFIAKTANIVGTYIVQNSYPQKSKKAKPSPLHEFTAPCREFAGRDKELGGIKASLSSWYDDEERENSVNRIFVIQGLGGMGKSNLAFKFAQLNREAYDCILQIGAQTKESMVAGFQRFAHSLKVELKEKRIDITRDEVERIYRTAAEVYQRVLIIFDNAERLHSATDTFGIFDYLANNACIRNKPVFLVTTRNGGEAWEAHGENTDSVPSSQRLSIDILGVQESYTCLLKQLRLEDKKSEIGLVLEASIQKLATLLGGYPLSMSLIAGIIARKVRAEAFGEDLESQAKYYIEFLSPDKIQEHEGDQNHQAKLSLIFKETLRNIRLEEDGDMAEQLLGMIAYLQPDASYAGFLNSLITKTEFDIRDPDKLVVKCEQLSPAVKGGLKILQAFSIISVYEKRENYQYGLEFVHDKIRVHRLIQAQAQTNLVARKLNTVKILVDLIEVTNCSSLGLLYDTETVDILLHHHEPKEVARQILVVFWRIDALNFGYFGTKQKLFLNKLQAVSEHLCEDEKFMLELGKTAVKYRTTDKSSTDPRQDSHWIFKQVLNLRKEFLKKNLGSLELAHKQFQGCTIITKGGNEG